MLCAVAAAAAAVIAIAVIINFVAIMIITWRFIIIIIIIIMTIIIIMSGSYVSFFNMDVEDVLLLSLGLQVNFGKMKNLICFCMLMVVHE